MVITDLFRGQLVRLAAEQPQLHAKAWSQWLRNSEYMLLLDTDPPVLWSEQKIKAWVEKELEKDDPGEFYFMIHTLQDDRLIGFLSLNTLMWNHGDAWLAIGLGEADLWGKGYGSDALQLALRYAFDELNLHRVTLSVFEYNPRAIRAYQKAGFVEEGRVRGSFLRQGRRWDEIYMGILRQEWRALTVESG